MSPRADDPSIGDRTDGQFDPGDVMLCETGDPAIRVIAILDPLLNYERSDALKAHLVGLLEREMTAGCRRFILDLDRLGVIDSSGFAALLSLDRRVREAGGTMVICGLSPMVTRLFDLTGLDRVFAIHATVDEALAAPEGSAPE